MGPNRRAQELERAAARAAEAERKAIAVVHVNEAAKYLYAKQKTFEAPRALVGNDTFGMRLAYARECLLGLRAHPELPAELRPRLDSMLQIRNETKKSAVSYRVTPLRLRSRGDKVAKQILEFYTDLMGGL